MSREIEEVPRLVPSRVGKAPAPCSAARGRAAGACAARLCLSRRSASFLFYVVVSLLYGIVSASLLFGDYFVIVLVDCYVMILLIPTSS